MPTNDSGYELTVGPDHQGGFFTVPAGEQYELPVPPQDENPEPEPPADEPDIPVKDEKPVKGDTGKDAAR